MLFDKWMSLQEIYRTALRTYRKKKLAINIMFCFYNNFPQVNVLRIDKAFIRLITTVILNNSLLYQKSYKLDEKSFKNNVKLLQKCLDAADYVNDYDEDVSAGAAAAENHLEVECLYAVQILINKLEYPSGKFNLEIFFVILKLIVVSTPYNFSNAYRCFRAYI